MKKKKISICVLIIAMALVLYFTLKDDFKSIVLQLTNVNRLFFILAIIVFLLALLLKAEGLKTFLCEYKKDYSLLNSFKLTLIAQFLNGITPFQSGGQPFQIYLLKKEGIRISDSTNAMLKDFVAFQIALILIGVFAIVANLKLAIIMDVGYLNLLIFLGFLVNLIVLTLLILVLYAKETVKKIINKVLNFAYRFKFMKMFSVKKENLMKSLEHFYETGNEIRKNKSKLFKGIICNVISHLFFYLIPYIVFISLRETNVTPLCSIICVAFVMLIGNFIPIPGATGGIEYSFLKFFGIYVKNPLLSSAMLLWRFITYIFGMLIGFVTLIIRGRTLGVKYNK